jgi:hypothetical protein
MKNIKLRYIVNGVWRDIEPIFFVGGEYPKPSQTALNKILDGIWHKVDNASPQGIMIAIESEDWDA